jgi:hypothetical protein
MKKMMLLASVVALAALMLAAAPAFAQGFPAAPCDRLDEEFLPPGLRDKCDNNEDNNVNDIGFVFCDRDRDGHDDGDDDCDFNNNDNDRDIFRNIGNVDVSPNIDISQDIDQDADSGDISQPVSVTGGGDNSIQTVGVQPTANTGNAQNATGVLQAAPIVAGLGGDTLINNEDDNGFFNDFCDDHDCFDNNDNGRDFCDDHDCFDNNDNGRDFCDHHDCFDNNDNGRDFCDHHDCFDNNDDNDNNDRDVFRNIGNDRLNINGPDFGDVGVDSNASIGVSPAQVVNGGGEINQAAAASSQ